MAPTTAPEPARQHLRGLVVALAFAVLVAALTKITTLEGRLYDQDIASQSIAQDTIRAQFPFMTESLQATKDKREEAARSVLDRYRVDREKVRIQLDWLQQQIEALRGEREALEAAIRDALMKSRSDERAEDVVSQVVAAYAAQIRQEPAFESLPDAASLAVWLMPNMNSLPRRVFEKAPDSADAENLQERETPRSVVSLDEADTTGLTFSDADRLAELARDGLEYVLTHGVVDAGLHADSASRKIVIMREDPVAGQRVTEELTLGELPSAAQAGELLRARIVEKAKQMAGETGEGPLDWAKLHDAALDMARRGIVDTLSYDRVYTESARELARSGAEPVMKEIQPGEIIQRAGERWTEQTRSDVNTYWALLESDRSHSSRMLGSTLAHMILVALALACLVRAMPVLYSVRDQKTAGFSRRLSGDLNLSLLLMCGTLIAGRIVSYFEPSGFILPVHAVGILLAILINVRVALLVALLTAALVSVQFGYDWRVLTVASAMSLGSVFTIFTVRRRSDITRAALQGTAVGLLVMLAITLGTDSLFSEAAMQRLGLFGINGAICLLVVPGMLAPLERAFGITTDIQLLEYSDLNNEVLSRLAIEVPATYAHCLMLGQLAEAAADAIGANGLLARVSAYYHDIGKLRRPEYFSENQTGVNIHDELSPRLSARAIAAHVTQGVELAREYHLPKPITDAIREHHGTCLIGYFYQQAVERQKHGDVREQDFRYPGPKPQSRETGILMICDAIESGVRSIKHPNEERVREFVDKIISSRSADRQFDDCHLTLKDLDVICSVLTKRVLSAAHIRVAYPGLTPEERQAPNVIPLSGGSE